MPEHITRATPAEDRAAAWRSRLSIFVAGILVFETLSGFSIWLLPFGVPKPVLVLRRALGGLAFLAPYLVYQWKHWQRYRNRALSHYSVTGYVAFAAIVLNALSGVILAAQAVLGTRISYVWDAVHIVTTVALVAFVVPRGVLLFPPPATASAAAAAVRRPVFVWQP